MMPACTGPTGTWNTPSPVTGRNGWKSPGTRGTSRVVREILAKRPRTVRPVVVERDARRVRMALGHEAEEVHDLAFEPVRRRMFRRDRRERRRRRIDRRHDVQKRLAGAATTTRGAATKAARRLPLVAREQRHQPSVETQARRDRRAPAARPPSASSDQLSSAQLADRAVGDAERGRHGCDDRRHDAPHDDLRRRANERHQRSGQVERGHDRERSRPRWPWPCRDRSVPAADCAGPRDRAAVQARGVPPDTRSRRKSTTSAARKTDVAVTCEPREPGPENRHLAEEQAEGRRAR